MLDILARASKQAEEASSNSTAEMNGVTQMLNLLERGVADSEPKLGMNYALQCWIWGRTSELHSRAQRNWKKMFRLFFAQNQSQAVKTALVHAKDQSSMKPFVFSAIESVIKETAERDLQAASELVAMFCAETTSNDVDLGKKMRADLDERMTRKNAALMEDYFLAAPNAAYNYTAEDFEKRLRKIFDLARGFRKKSSYEYMAAKLWADLFDRYVVADRESAIRLGFEMAGNARDDSATSEQIAQSLCAIRDPQRAAFLRQSNGLRIPVFRTRIHG